MHLRIQPRCGHLHKFHTIEIILFVDFYIIFYAFINDLHEQLQSYAFHQTCSSWQQQQQGATWLLGLLVNCRCVQQPGWHAPWMQSLCTQMTIFGGSTSLLFFAARHRTRDTTSSNSNSNSICISNNTLSCVSGF
jgi:hypothetical protein